MSSRTYKKFIYEESPAEQIKQKALKKSQEIIYVYKTPEEKKTILLGAMENWIQGMMEHCGDLVMAWDVINEPIADNSSWRGINGNFMSNGEGEDPDTEPVEDNGLDLNWANDHFYWGYYLGKEYAVKAFEYARQYAPEGTKLYANDYNLEHNQHNVRVLPFGD